MACLVIFVSVLVFGGATLFGRFAVIDELFKHQLDAQLSIYEQDIANHYDNLAALGIRMSQNLSSELEADGYTPDVLNGNSTAIESMESKLYDTLYKFLQLADCSGAYFFLDATVNPTLPDAENSKCGLYLKIANLNSRKPVDIKVIQYRGSTGVGGDKTIEYHNMWALEFNVSQFPDYDMLKANADKNLNKSYLFTEAMGLPGTWEDIVLFCVPIVGSDGTFYGICGFEISELSFKLFHTQFGAFTRIAGILAPIEYNAILTDSGLQSGGRDGYFANFSGELRVKSSKYFNIYSAIDGERFIGTQTIAELSPLGEKLCVAVMIPKSDYDMVSSAEMQENIVMLLLLILSALFGCIVISRLYIRPIFVGIDRIKNGNITADSSGVQEIDDLLDYLSRQDAARQQELRELERTISTREPQVEIDNTPVFTPEEVREFKEKLSSLTKTEREVFDLYMEGHRAKDMPAILCRSINTIKTHNKRIYEKLDVKSSAELRSFMFLLKEEQYDNVTSNQ